MITYLQHQVRVDGGALSRSNARCHETVVHYLDWATSNAKDHQVGSDGQYLENLHLKYYFQYIMHAFLNTFLVEFFSEHLKYFCIIKNSCN